MFKNRRVSSKNLDTVRSDVPQRNEGGPCESDNSQASSDLLYDKPSSTEFASRQNLEYSADLQPLKFKMTRTPDLEEVPSHVKTASADVDSFYKVRNRLQKIADPSWNFSSIDQEQFEIYLKEPEYIKVFKKHEDLEEFKRLFLAQELNVTTTKENDPTAQNTDASNKAIWTLKFSHDGKYMATGSKDGCVMLWKVISSPVERWELDRAEESNLVAMAKSIRIKQNLETNEAHLNAPSRPPTDTNLESLNLYAPIFHPNPVRIYKEHSHDILDLDWSKNNFLLTASMDKLVSLWHPDRETSLKSFPHPDFVTSVRFHPKDDRFFVSGCLDHKCRMWSILENKVVYEFDCQDLITAISISPGVGEFTIIGTFNGYITILSTFELKPLYTFHVLDKHMQGNSGNDSSFKNLLGQNLKNHHGPRVTGLQLFLEKETDDLKLLVSSTDSRIRIFDLEKNKLAYRSIQRF